MAKIAHNPCVTRLKIQMRLLSTPSEFTRSDLNFDICLVDTSVARLLPQCDSYVYYVGQFRCPSAKLQSQSTNRKVRNVNLLISLSYLCSWPAYAARSRGPFLWALM